MWAMSNHPVPLTPGYPAARQNPEGMAAFGAVIGVMVGGLSGTLLSIPFRPSEIVEAVAEDPDEAMAQADAQAMVLLQKWARWRRISHVISGVMATAGSAVGAYLGASPHQKRGAALGAAIGTGAMRTLNVAVNPAIGLPGIVAGGVGAYIGAKRAERHASAYVGAPAPAMY